MSERYRQAKRALCGIYQEIFEYAYDHYSLPLEWNGGEVFITSNPSRGASLKPGRLTIITPGAPEIAWLLTRLGDAFGSLRSDAFKPEFYERLVRLIRSHEITAARPYRVNSILKTVIDEAFAMLEEMEEKERRPTPAMLERHPALAASGDHSAVATKQLFPM